MPGIHYSHLLPQDAWIAPWFDVAIDLIEPWQVTISSQVFSFQALTCIDTVTHLAEVICINNKSSKHISLLFENNWLAQYPCPSRCVHNNGGEFTGAAFAHMLWANGIKDVTTTVKNPQAHAICKRLHQSISNSLQTMLHKYPPINIDQINEIMDTCFATAAYAPNVAIDYKLNMSLDALVFQRDIIINIPLIMDLLHFYTWRQSIFDEFLQQANLHCRTIDYQSRDKILILINNPTTLQDHGIDPFTTTQVYTNGTITFHCIAHTVEQINVCWVKPFWQWLCS